MKASDAAAVADVVVSVAGLALEHRAHSNEAEDHIETARVLSKIIVERERACPDNR